MLRVRSTLKMLPALLAFAGACLADQPLTFPTVVTTKGVKYEDVKVSKFDALNVKFIHRNGAATVPLSELPEEMQKIFGYDPVSASFEMIVQQQERRQNIIQEADKKAKEAEIMRQQELDVEELKLIRKNPVRCFVNAISRDNERMMLYVSPVDKLPVKIRSRSGKYERYELDGQGKPELREQVVPGQDFVYGNTIQILPAGSFVGMNTFTTVYLVKSRDGWPTICAFTPEYALKYRRQIAAMEAEEKSRSTRP